MRVFGNYVFEAEAMFVGAILASPKPLIQKMKIARSAVSPEESQTCDALDKSLCQGKFVACGIAASEEARRTREYFAAQDVHAELIAMLRAAKASSARR
ncbi:hypothetical protein [Caballeronia arvi]|uniref:hypothetical protein n=1 Tax=Caballeronia arvi TaxID=1777135 RepID=UPI0011814AE5|nr:hypothetical protein [Caballeronia arvi]